MSDLTPKALQQAMADLTANESAEYPFKCLRCGRVMDRRDVEMVSLGVGFFGCTGCVTFQEPARPRDPEPSR